MRLFVFLSIILNTCFGFDLTCKVLQHNLVKGEAKYAVHLETKSIKISLVTSASSFEQQLGCDSSNSQKPHLSIIGITDSETRDHSFCETQNFLEVNKKTISYSNYNDHDVPEEVIDLFKVGSVYYGTLLSVWDTHEELELRCQERL